MQILPSCTDYTTSVVNSLVKAPMLSMGQPEMYKGRPVKYTGGFCIVFPYMANGKKYADQFKDNKYDGYGKKIYPDGSYYEGNFLKGVFHGKGMWYYSNGDKLEGIWDNGVRNGVFHKVLKNREEFNVEYKNDEKIREELIRK